MKRWSNQITSEEKRGYPFWSLRSEVGRVGKSQFSVLLFYISHMLPRAVSLDNKSSTIKTAILLVVFNNKNINICRWVNEDFQRKCCRSLPNNSALPPRHDQTKEGPHCNDRKSGRNGWVAQAFRLLCFKIRRHRIGRCTEERIIHERTLWLHKYHHCVSIHHQHWHVQRMLVKGWQLSDFKGKQWQPKTYQIVWIRALYTSAQGLNNSLLLYRGLFGMSWKLNLL